MCIHDVIIHIAGSFIFSLPLPRCVVPGALLVRLMYGIYFSLYMNTYLILGAHSISTFQATQLRQREAFIFPPGT